MDYDIIDYKLNAPSFRLPACDWGVLEMEKSGGVVYEKEADFWYTFIPLRIIL